MIPDYFKKNLELDVLVFDCPVKVNYRFWWPEPKGDGKDPMFGHIEFRAEPGLISSTGYRSHFFHTDYLKETPYRSIAEFVVAVGEHFAREIG
ncbi:hypothetical protein [Pedobacter sp. GR22-6]|uniref:hypothetical protein n=1 Tax=Pedobacter sp. GR22-6 TaxID=3127957 RepID=UPI00307F73B7